ncbi:MAG: ATP-binding cassette domain-containing protein [Prevotella sp.]|nr:ATP-binding cassette domain-containing protein [Prevotella sp.]
MEKIVLESVVPRVFADGRELHSDIWNNSVTFERGHLYLIESESGKGKSTFCSYILGYRNDYTGCIRFDDGDIRMYDTSAWVDIRRRHVSHLFQELRLFPELTAYENVEVKNRLMGGFKPADRIAGWFDMLGIADKRDTPVGKMSFGQQQRVALIRALVQPFDFLLVDEPISHLDDENAAIMARMMMQEAGEQGAGVIVTSIGKHMDLNYERVFRL